MSSATVEPSAKTAARSRIRGLTANKWAPIFAAATICVIGAALGSKMPTWLDFHLAKNTDDLYQWIVIHREKFWAFKYLFHPLATAMLKTNSAVTWILNFLKWPGVVALFFGAGLLLGGIRTAITAALLMLGCGIVGLWPQTIDTLSLIVVSVVVALLIGVPLGIWAGLSDRAESILRPLLDVAQVMPAYVYLLPIVVLFGIGIPAAVVATVVFAVPPAVKLTSLGIRSIAEVQREVGMAAGTTPRQLLTKVQLPLARRTILLGLNQVIMMAFGIVVIAALVGTGGLGIEVLNGLQKIDVGKSFLPGLALVFTAIALDRITASSSGQGKVPKKAPQNVRMLRSTRRNWSAMVGLVAGIGLIATAIGGKSFPKRFQVDFSSHVNSAIQWIQNHVRKGVPVIGGTVAISDFIVRDLLNPIRSLFVNLPWWAVIAAFVVIAWKAKGPSLALLCVGCFLVIGGLRVWDLSMETLSQVLIVVLLSVVIALPIGVLAGRSDRFEAVIKPVLDGMQVLPTFVYLVPVIALFTVGRVPGIIASIIYALPPCIRLTSLGLREASASAREAANAFGATPMQELLKVQIPLSLRSVMLGINQSIMMALSMVIVAALVGAGGLGLETVYGLTKSEIGRGLAGGLAIVALAVVLDRITQAWGAKAQK